MPQIHFFLTIFMEGFVKSLLILLSVLFIGLYSCSDKDSSTSSSSSSWESLNGSWDVAIGGQTISQDLTGSKDKVHFNYMDFTGSWSGNQFTGTYDLVIYTLKLNLKVENSTHISGSIENAALSTMNESFTGVKK